ncbi:MAG: 2-C-methyl-D-erythritol 4-phosphate cytidylyltransferase [Gemmatimonadetes bacterium]|nr:2-C-methyl-D-erythritol 4-phosphate cytidylyltransferase [Gemmatimonadota bacterium]
MSERSSAASFPDGPRVGAVVVAGGEGLRMAGATGPTRKQYALLLDEPVLAWAVRPFTGHPRVREVVVVLPAADVETPPGWLLELGVAIVAGGRTRTESVRNGLAWLADATELALIHDAARPFVSAELIDRVIASRDGAAVIPAIRATDTLKQVADDGRILSTIDRGTVWMAQTPQGFPFAALRAAHAEAALHGWDVTDDAGLFERIGAAVRVVEGDPENMKITRPFDLDVARLLAARRRGRSEPVNRPPAHSG